MSMQNGKKKHAACHTRVTRLNRICLQSNILLKYGTKELREKSERKWESAEECEWRRRGQSGDGSYGGGKRNNVIIVDIIHFFFFFFHFIRMCWISFRKSSKNTRNLSLHNVPPPPRLPSRGRRTQAPQTAIPATFDTPPWLSVRDNTTIYSESEAFHKPKRSFGHLLIDIYAMTYRRAHLQFKKE